MNQVFSELLEKYLTNKLTKEEEQELIRLSGEDDNRVQLEAIINRDLEENVFATGENSRLRELIYHSIEEKIEGAKIVPVQWWKRIAVAASVVLMLGAGSYFLFFNKPVRQNDIVKTTLPDDVKAPAGNRAIITLASGENVFLDSTSNGTLATEGNVQLVKLANGQIVYNGSATEIVFNTLTNPRGSTVINMTLADGSKVWLNAGSSVTYPVAFVGNERKVSVTGEAYFEITHDAAKPFIVSKGENAITVLGTHFNINAYDDEENIKVTLLEGSVKVSKGFANGLLKPGQQARVSSEINVVTGVDVDEVMAWKKGRFQFNKASLQEVMRQISRWYDVEIIYEGKIAPQQFGGKMQRDLNLSEVLDGLAKSQVHFRIEGKKLIVMP